MGKDRTKQYTFGACDVTLGGSNIGYIDDNGAKAIFTYKEIPGMAADFDEMALNMFMSMKSVEVELTLLQTEISVLNNVFPLFNKVTNTAGSSKLQFGFYAGKLITAQQLIITPKDSTLSTLVPLTLYRVVPVEAPEIIYVGNKPQGWKVKFRALADDSKSDGNWIGTLGDATIVADIVAPTVTTVAPADAASGQATSVAIVWTMSEELDDSTVNTETVKIFKTPFSVGTPTTLGVAGSVALVNNGASTTITFTPTAALTAAKSYVAMLSSTIKDKAGNRLTGTVDGQVAYLTDFATA